MQVSDFEFASKFEFEVGVGGVEAGGDEEFENWFVVGWECGVVGGDLFIYYMVVVGLGI